MNKKECHYYYMNFPRNTIPRGCLSRQRASFPRLSESTGRFSRKFWVSHRRENGELCSEAPFLECLSGEATSSQQDKLKAWWSWAPDTVLVTTVLMLLVISWLWCQRFPEAWQNLLGRDRCQGKLLIILSSLFPLVLTSVPTTSSWINAIEVPSFPIVEK